jgi:hypothetical protein
MSAFIIHANVIFIQFLQVKLPVRQLTQASRPEHLLTCAPCAIPS